MVVLFDAGITHSFITTNWVATHNLTLKSMSLPMLINSLGGKTKATRYAQI
jgi:hypothetical protein